MKIKQRFFNIKEGWSDENIDLESQLVLAFASPSLVKLEKSYDDLKKFFPKADIVLVSTSGEILDIDVNDETISVSALYFEKTPIKVISKEIENMKDSFEIGAKLAKEINSDDLKYSIIFSDGLGVNGTKLVEGISKTFNGKVGITGGLAGDGADFQETYVSLNGAVSSKNNIVIIGLYGDSINIGNASVGGWDTFGVERTITKSEGNTIYEIDGEPVLDLYKRYLGDKADLLPGSGLLFPISIYKDDSKSALVRTLLAVDKKNKSITFAGDTPEGHKAFLMKANFSNLIEGSENAAKISFEKNNNPDFALLISCVGRKLVLKQRIEEEIDAIRDIIGEESKIAGFYSYGEIGINKGNGEYNLHNQTMTIALFSEK